MTSYPASMPTPEILEVISVIRSGKAKENVPLVAQRLWVIQGYAMKSALGDPNGSDTAPLSPFTMAAKPEGFCALDVLEKHCKGCDDAVTAQAVDVPWSLIIKWALDELAVLLV